MTKQSQLILLCLVLGVHSIVLIGYRQPLLRQPAETEARKDSPVIMLTELQQTLELTSHAMVRDPKLLVRVHEHGYTGPVWKSTFPTINPHSTEPEDTSNLAAPKSVWGRPLFDWTRQYSKSIAPLPALPEQHQTPTETFQPRYLPPLRCSSAIPLSQESPRSKRILLDGGELSCYHPFNWKSASVPRARWKPFDGLAILAMNPFSPRFIRRSSNSSNGSNLPP